MLLKSIKIKNFRNIKNMEIDLSSNKSGSENNIVDGGFIDIGSGKILPYVNAIIGANAVGKSNVLDAINMFYASTEKYTVDVVKRLVMSDVEDPLSLSSEDFIKRIQEYSNQILDMNDDGELRKRYFDVRSKMASNIFNKNALNSDENIEIKLIFTRDKKEFEASLIINNGYLDVNTPEDLKISDIPVVHRFDENEHSLKEFTSGKGEMYYGNLLKLAPEKILKLIRVADPSIEHVVLEGKTLIFKVKHSDFPVSFRSLSFGTKRFLWIASFIIQKTSNDNALILLDEIEPFMHKELAEAIIKIMNLIAKKNKNTSFIFTTHNPMLVGSHILNKQVTEIKNQGVDGNHSAVKLSTLFKNHESIEKKYKKGIICDFPSSAFVTDSIWEVINE